MSARTAQELRQAERAAYQADVVRHQILHHASELFTHYGFGKTNIGDIAQCCCMSPGNIYRYFKNKQAIGLAVVEECFHMAQAAMETELMLPATSAEDRIRRFLTAGIGVMANSVVQHPKIVELAEFLMENERGLELLGQHIGWKRNRIIENLEAGIKTGEIAPCDTEKTAATMLTALKIFFMPTTLVRWREPDTILPELNDVMDLIFRGVRAK